MLFFTMFIVEFMVLVVVRVVSLCWELLVEILFLLITLLFCVQSTHTIMFIKILLKKEYSVINYYCYFVM